MRLIGISDYPLGSIKPEVMQMLRMAEALVLQGCRVILYIPSGQRTSWTDIEQIYGRFRVHFPIRTIKDIGIPKQVTKLPRILGRLAFHCWSLFRALLIKSQIISLDEIIMTRNIYIAWLQTKFNKPVIFEAMSLPSKGQLLLLKQICLSSSARCIVAISNGLAEDLVDMLGFRPHNLVVLPMGVDLDQFAADISKDKARQLVGLPQDVPIATYTGAGLRGDRELETIVRVAKALPGILFVIVGGRKEEIEILSRLAEQLEARNILFTGYVHHSRVVLYQKAADVLLLLGSPRDKHQSRHASYAKMFEYMASGVPILATDLPSIREVLCHGGNAWLVPPGDSKALAEGIQHLLENSDLAERLARQAREDVQQYTWKRRAAMLLQYVFGFQKTEAKW